VIPAPLRLVAKHDLIHKAKGQMWREAGKGDKSLREPACSI